MGHDPTPWTIRQGSIILSRTPAAAAIARRFARSFGTGDSNFDTVELLVSELVTNAVLHAEGDPELTIRDLGDRIRVEVSDTSPRPPQIDPPNLTGGRGLQLVDTLAARWGTDRRPAGKTVWFEVDRHQQT